MRFGVVLTVCDDLARVQLGVDTETAPALSVKEQLAMAEKQGRLLLTRRRKTMQRKNAKDLWCVRRPGSL